MAATPLAPSSRHFCRRGADAVTFTAAPQVHALVEAAAARDQRTPLLEAVRRRWRGGGLHRAGVRRGGQGGWAFRGCSCPSTPAWARWQALWAATCPKAPPRGRASGGRAQAVAMATTGLFGVVGALPQAGAPPKDSTVPSASTT